jgi:hypothetical protein
MLALSCLNKPNRRPLWLGDACNQLLANAAVSKF